CLARFSRNNCAHGWAEWPPCNRALFPMGLGSAYVKAARNMPDRAPWAARPGTLSWPRWIWGHPAPPHRAPERLPGRPLGPGGLGGHPAPPGPAPGRPGRLPGGLLAPAALGD